MVAKGTKNHTIKNCHTLLFNFLTMPNDILRRCEEEGCAYSQEVSNLTFSVCDTCYLLIHPNELLKKTQIYTTWSNKIMKTPRVDAN